MIPADVDGPAIPIEIQGGTTSQPLAQPVDADLERITYEISAPIVVPNHV